MELIFASPFTHEQQMFLLRLLFWITFSVAIYILLRGVDHTLKRDFIVKDLYNLGKTKWLFSFYDHKSGKIIGFIFWLNIFAHVFIISALISNIIYIINPNQTTTFISVIMTLGLVGLLIIIGIFGYYNLYKFGKKYEKREKTEDKN
ncbi:MAG: hypothetical protein FWE36_08355 [Erysipelotrichales bacterium]|nr:hypothetical protein [Erysipelotrichales bacterium]